MIHRNLLIIFCALIFSVSVKADQIYEWKLMFERKTPTGSIASRLSVQIDPTIINSEIREAWTALEQYENKKTPLSYIKYQFHCIGELKIRTLEGLWIESDNKPGIGSRFDEKWNTTPSAVEMSLMLYVCGVQK